VLIVCGIVDWFRMKWSQSRYGSFVSLVVMLSGINGGEPPVL
jgi:hypothetical protein